MIATKIPALKRRNLAGVIAALKPILAARGPKARLRTTRYRGVDTATMIYDQLPVNDVFRTVDDETVLGAMDLRGIAGAVLLRAAPRTSHAGWYCTLAASRPHPRDGLKRLAAATAWCAPAPAPQRRTAWSAADAPRH